MAEGGPFSQGKPVNSERPSQRVKRQRNETSTYCGFCCQESTSNLATCQGCKLSFCIKCSGLTEGHFKLISDEKQDGFQWNCKSCTNTLPTLENITGTLIEIKQMHENRMGNLEKKVENLGSELREEISDKITNIKLEVKNEVKDEMTTNIRNIVDERNRELEDRKRRETNLVFFNIQEKNEQNAQAEKQKDEDDVRQVAKDLGLEDIDITAMFRLGKKIQDKTRPIKIIIGSRNNKKFLLDNAKHIKSKVTSRLNKTVIVRDQTAEQRNERRQQRLAKQSENKSKETTNQSVPHQPPSPSLLNTTQRRPTNNILAQSTPIRPIPQSNLNKTPEQRSYRLDETMIEDITIIGGIHVSQSQHQPTSPDVERS